MRKTLQKLILFILIILPLTLIIVTCSTKEPDHSSYRVSYKGNLKNMMRKGDISVKASLADLQNIKHLYALGAIENLKGEIQIFNGKPFSSIVVQDSINIDTSFNLNATLLVYSVVKEWYEISIPENITTMEKLESFIENSAQQNQINTRHPFPFLIEGMANSVKWHVINWKEGDNVHTHEKHINSGLNGTIENREVKILGFYSSSHHGVFTHHTSNTHMHLKTIDEQIAGHVDELLTGSNMILKIPAK